MYELGDSACGFAPPSGVSLEKLGPLRRVVRGCLSFSLHQRRVSLSLLDYYSSPTRPEMTPPVLRSLGTGYQWPKALSDIDVAVRLPFRTSLPALDGQTLIPFIQPNSGAGRALRDALDKAGIDDDTPEISRTPKEQSLYRMVRMPLSSSIGGVGAFSLLTRSLSHVVQMDMHRYYTGNDGKPRDRHLRAELDEQHAATKHVFKTRDGKTPSVNVKHDHKKGKLTYTDLPTGPGSSGLESGFGGLRGATGNGGGGSCTCPLCVDGARPQTQPKSGCQCPICLPALLNGLGGGNARLLTNAGDVDPVAPNSPRTLQDLMDLLSVHKPGKKIIQVAGDLEIVQTKVCMLPIELGETGQSWVA